KIKINNITLHIFGGLAALEYEPKTPLAELRVAAAGPMASFILALVFYLLAEVLLRHSSSVIYQAALHLGTFNFLVACFNLLPGFPLDGGRVLRAILWYFDKSYEQATRLTIIFSIFFSVALVIVGLVNLLGDYNLLGGFWTLLAGFLLLRLVYKIPPELLFKATVKSSNLTKEKAVKDFISKDFVSVTPNITVAQALKTCQKAAFKTIPVIQTQQLHGILFIADIEKLAEKEQVTTFVYQIMKPVTAKHFVTLDISIEQATNELNNNGLGYVLVIDSNSLVVGFLSQKEIAFL
ncbi:MAG: Zn-dependent protease, partial [bacterium]